jgi:hypothetical protein
MAAALPREKASSGVRSRLATPRTPSVPKSLPTCESYPPGAEATRESDRRPLYLSTGRADDWNVKRAVTIALLVLTTSCGLGPSQGACESQNRELRQMQAQLDEAAARRQDLAPYVAAIEQARAAAEAAGC